jgi:hypothetical protein
MAEERSDAAPVVQDSGLPQRPTGELGGSTQPLSEQLLKKYSNDKQVVTGSGLPQRPLEAAGSTASATDSATEPPAGGTEATIAQPGDAVPAGSDRSEITKLGPDTYAHEQALDVALKGLIDSGLHPDLAEQVARLNSAGDVPPETRVAMKRRLVAEAGKPSDAQ